MKKTARLTFIIALAAALAASSGCARRQAGTPPALPVAETEARPERTGISRLFSFSDAGPAQSRWDGQTSGLAVKAPVNLTFTRCVEVLRALGFTLKTDETRRTGNSAQITAMKPDRTLAQIQLDEHLAGTTEVRVKVGATGDRTGSERILDDLQKALQKPAPGRAQPAAPAAR